MQWYQKLDFSAGKLYEVITQGIASGIRSGELRPGQRLPAQRALARNIGCTVGTISRAYQHAEQLGLISSARGSGSYIQPQAACSFAIPDASTQEIINLSINTPLLQHRTPLLSQGLQQLARQLPLSPSLMDYQADQGALHHRQQLAHWYHHAGIELRPENLLLTAGAQHGLALAFSAFTRPGDKLLAEALSYPGLKPLAKRFGLKLIPVAMDAQGLCMDDLARHYRHHLPGLLYCNPRIHNPTSTQMPEGRRRQLADFARQHKLLVFEDDVLAHFGPPQTPLYNLYPARTVYLSCLSKSLVPGLRLGLVAAEPTLIEQLSQTLRNDIWMASPLMSALAVLCIESGQAQALREQDCAELQQRRLLLSRLPDSCNIHCSEGSPHGWLELPTSVSAAEFSTQLQERGVLVKTASHFQIDPGQPLNAIRFSISAPLTRALLRDALGKMEQLLGTGL